MSVILGDRDFQRLVRFDGCFNFRDVGLYPTVEGRTVRPGRLYRADGPHGMSDDDTARLDRLGLATVIDLRTYAEGELHGRYSDRVPAVTEYHLPMTDTLPEPEVLRSWTDARALASYYRVMLVVGHDAICEALAILTDPASYPALIHCSAGKDRTGVLAAIILGALGVSDQSIIDDYELSGPAMVRLVAHLQHAYPDAQDRIDRLIPMMSSADPRAMQWFIGRVGAEYRSFPGYVASIGMQSAIPYARACLLER